MKAGTIRKTMMGVVLKNKMDKSVVVQVNHRVKHPQFKKYITRKRKVMAHDPSNQCGIGDKVRVCECRPLSKSKHWRLLEVIEKAV